jgi:parallel beta-helix repeat protein
VSKAHLSCDHVIERAVRVADARTDYSAVRPGDTVCIAAGNRGVLVLKNFRGTPSDRITFINFGGAVVIDSDTSHGILLQNSRFFRLTGSGASGIDYGIKVVHSTNLGIQIVHKSSDFEVDHIEVRDVDGAGMGAKSRAVCSDGSTNDYDYDADGNKLGDLDDVVNRGNFVQYDSVFHDNYIHHVGTEGFYVGSSHYQEGRELTCASGPETAYDPVIVGVSIYDNKVTDTGMDGIQVGSAIENCDIYRNVILRDSRECNIYSNFIKDGGGPGMYIHGNGGNIIYNNVIINAGEDESLGNNPGHGIVVTNGSNPGGNSIYVLNNTIVTPRTFGIKFLCDRGSDSRVQNNIIVAPGNYDAYAEDAYIQTGGRGVAAISNNITTQTLAEVRFAGPASTDYSLQPNSPAVDSGIDWHLDMPATDFDGISRPQGNSYDIGAYEFAP